MDTPGQERFKTGNEAYYKRSDSIVLSYDITDRKSFEDCKTYYCIKIKELCRPNIKTILIGNKKDLEEYRKVTFKEANDFALSNGYMFLETSCLKYENVYETFENIIEATLEEMQNEKLIIKKDNSIFLKKEKFHKMKKMEKNNCFII